MMRGLWLGAAVVAAGVGLGARGGTDAGAGAAAAASVDVVEATIFQLQNGLAEGRFDSRDLVQAYLDRIVRYEDRVNATAAISASAMAEAAQLDRERAAGHVRGPLHGIPIGIKDIINTTSMPTTGGGLAFAGFAPPYDAPLIKNLRDAGAIIFTKTVLTEFANWVAAAMPANYSGLFGYGYNPYDPRQDPRDTFNDGRPALGTGGSSSGIGTTLSFWAASVGTETSGSILSPSNQNMLAGIKPTVGLIGRYGIAPITADQDTAGPMARTVADAAILLGAHGRLRSQRSRHRHLPATAGPRLHPLLTVGRAARRAHRHPPGRLLPRPRPGQTPAPRSAGSFRSSSRSWRRRSPS